MAPDNPMTNPGIIWRSDDLTAPIEGWRGTLEIRAGGQVILGNPDVPLTFTGMNLKVECKTCGQTVPANTAHHCPGGRILTEAEVRRIVREELAGIERSKPSTDNP